MKLKYNNFVLQLDYRSEHFHSEVPFRHEEPTGPYAKHGHSIPGDQF